jgi:hypothetical protein
MICPEIKAVNCSFDSIGQKDWEHVMVSFETLSLYKKWNID